MNKYLRIIFLLTCFAPFTCIAQKIAIKTNTLYWATASPNLEAEFRLNPHFTLSIAGTGNLLSISNTKLHLAQVAPELRYWLRRPMSRHFIGLHASLTEYDLKFNSHIYKGNAFAAGVTYGFVFVLNPRWNLETTLGLGGIKYNTFDYKTGTPKPKDPNKTGTRFAPIKAGVSFTYILY